MVEIASDRQEGGSGCGGGSFAGGGGAGGTGGGLASSGSSSGNLQLKDSRESAALTTNSAIKRGLGSRSFSIQNMASILNNNVNNTYLTNANNSNNNNPPVVVGPVTFYTLLEEDIMALEYCINHGHLEGWRISRIDQFSRRIVLELLIPNIDTYTITNKHANANFSSYYRSEDIKDLYHYRKSSAGGGSSGGAQGQQQGTSASASASASSPRYMELTVTFPLKYAGFWSPTFEVEDKSGLGVSNCFIITCYPE